MKTKKIQTLLLIILIFLFLIPSIQLVYAAVVPPWTSTFEDGTHDDWDVETGTVDINTLHPSQGVYGANVTGEDDTTSGLTKTTSVISGFGVNLSAYFYFTKFDFEDVSYPQSPEASVLSLFDDAIEGISVSVYNSSGTTRWRIRYSDGSSALVDAGALNPSINTWFKLELYVLHYLFDYTNYAFSINDTQCWSANNVPADYPIGDDIFIGYQNLWSFGSMDFEGYFDEVCFEQEATLLSLSFDNETSTTVYDQSGNGNNGTITGATRSYDGHFGMALDFDGTNYITVPDNDTLDLTSTVALSAWVKPSTVSGSQIIFDKPNAYGLALFNDSIGMMINGDYYNSSTGVINTDTWYHIVGEYNSTYINIYLDETLIYNTSLSDPISVSAFDLIIGDGFEGIIDECIISTSYSSDLLDPIADYPYVYDGYVDTTACSWILSTLTYNFTNIYIQQNSTYPLTYVMFNFTDGETELGLSYTVSSATFDEMGNEEDVEKLSFITRSVTTSNNALTLYARIRIEETILSYADVDLFLYCETSTANDSLTIEDRFSIYGIGGVTTTTVVGDGSLIAGGSIFDVMAQNSSETGSGSSIRVDTVTPNFQHFHALTHLYQDASWDAVNEYWDCPTDDTESGYLEYGVDYMEENCTWVTGWKVRIEVVDGQAGTFGVSNDEAWVRLNVTWYNNGSIVKADDVYASYEAYKHDSDFNDTTTQFSLYIDLWISSDEFSSNIAGHVSSQYYGMRESGWWLWSSWGPVGTLQTSSTFYDDLYNQDGNVTSASTLKVFRVWSKIAKVSSGAGSCDDHLWASENEVIQFKSLPFNIDLVGISTPVFMPTSTPDAPLGFFASIGNIISQALDSIYNAVIGLAQAGVALTASVLDSAFGIIGISNFSTTITSFMGTFADYFATSIGYITSLVVDFFTLFAAIFIFIIEWFGRVVDMFISIAGYVVGILDGTASITTGIGDLWAWIEIGEWIDIIPLVMLLWWWDSMDQRAKRMGGGWMGIFMGDINAIISVFSFMLDLSWRVVNMIIDLGMRFINMFVPL